MFNVHHFGFVVIVEYDYFVGWGKLQFHGTMLLHSEAIVNNYNRQLSAASTFLWCLICLTLIRIVSVRVIQNSN